MPSVDIPEAVSFEQAIALTQTLLSAIAAASLSEFEIEQTISALVKTKNGARGFFVTYLTDERSPADHPSSAVIRALQSAPEGVAELLVKNLAMSTAMILTHERHHKPEMAAGSELVQRRTLQLMYQLQLPEVEIQLQHLHDSVATGAGKYADFLNRWGYDDEQRQAIQQVLAQARLNPSQP